ncbi:MAG: hypothetical protein GPJ54_20460 [Candidatus Heimdallarchaeota archaeon]|nr:hypothetical protein [Candidatus Heimdallarchaeota archaeon]
MSNLRNLKYFVPLVLLFFTPISASIHLAPSIVDKPDDLIYEVGMTNNILVWVFQAGESNDDPSKYTAKLDGVPIVNHTLADWSDLTEIVINVDGLALGSYVVSIEVNDTGTDALQAASAFDSVNVHVVEDTANPFPSTMSTITATPTTETTSATSTTTTAVSTSNPVSEAVDRINEGKTSVSDSKTTDSTSSVSLPNSFYSITISLLSVGILTRRMRTRYA